LIETNLLSRASNCTWLSKKQEAAHWQPQVTKPLTKTYPLELGRVLPIKPTNFLNGSRKTKKNYFSTQIKLQFHMRVVVQRVKKASVTIEKSVTSSIGMGLLILVGIEENDTTDDALWLAQKITAMRIFSDSDGKMNLDLIQAGGELLVVSQFTLHAQTKKGNRPSFIRAARPEKAIPLYTYFIEQLQNLHGRPIQTGTFGAMMDVELINDGPVTIWMDTAAKE
jgi:D-tyrosyl-tRNA(Tyr) deacylase